MGGKLPLLATFHNSQGRELVGNMVLSIETEFIENESEDVTKQDCEINAFYRLAEKIKISNKRLPICILGERLSAPSYLLLRMFSALVMAFVTMFPQSLEDTLPQPLSLLTVS